MKGKDQIEDIFKRKLENAEFNVDPSVWANVSANIPTATGGVIGTVKGLSFASKLIIGAGVVTAITVSSILLVNKDQEELIQPETNKEVVAINTNEQPESIIIDSNQEHITFGKPVEVEPVEEVINTEDQSPSIVEILPIQEVNELLDRDQLIQEDALIRDNIDTPIVIEEPSKEEEKNTEPIIVSTDSVDEELPAVENEVTLTLPNVFTPNNDGNNDFYTISYTGVIVDASIVIFDKKGEVVFRDSNPDFEWNGFDLKGEPCPKGKYLLMITGHDSSGKEVLKSMNFDLLR